jgi:hypothetical protein
MAIEKDGHRYHVLNSNRNGTKRLRCSDYNKGCNGWAIEENGQVRITKEHNHPSRNVNNVTDLVKTAQPSLPDDTKIRTLYKSNPIKIENLTTNHHSTLYNNTQLEKTFNNINDHIDENQLKFKHPFNMIVGGASGSGKTRWIMKFLKSHAHLIDIPMKHILYCYGVYDNDVLIFQNWGMETHYGLPTEEKLKELPKPLLVIFDDLMIDSKSKYLDILFTRGSHHWNMSIVFVAQNLFNKQLSNARTNAHYLVLLKSPSSELQIRILGAQLFPRNLNYFMESYADATDNPFGYLVINNHPRGNKQLKLTSEIFPNEYLTVYSNSDNKMNKKRLIDLDELGIQNDPLMEPIENQIEEEGKQLQLIKNNRQLPIEEKNYKTMDHFNRLVRLIHKRESRPTNVNIVEIGKNLLEGNNKKFNRSNYPKEEENEDEWIWDDEDLKSRQYGSGSILFSRRPGLPMKDDEEEEEVSDEEEIDEEEYQQFLKEWNRLQESREQAEKDKKWYDEQEKKEMKRREEKVSDKEDNDEKDYQKFLKEWKQLKVMDEENEKDIKWYEDQEKKQQGRGHFLEHKNTESNDNKENEQKGKREKLDFFLTIIADGDLKRRARIIEGASDLEIKVLHKLIINMLKGNYKYTEKEKESLEKSSDLYHSLRLKRRIDIIRKILLTKEGLKSLGPLLSKLCRERF